MVFYKVYIRYNGGTPYSVRSSIKYYIGIPFCVKNEIINIIKTMYLNYLPIAFFSLDNT